jgi:hypothetical protein
VPSIRKVRAARYTWVVVTAVLAVFITRAANAQTYEDEHYCLPNGPCYDFKQELATTPNPWWFEVASIVARESDDYEESIQQLVNISSIKVDSAGVRTFTARAELEELDKRHFKRTGDLIFEHTVQVDCAAHRFRILDFRTGSSLSLNQTPVPMKEEHSEWRPLADSFAFNGLHGSAFADAVC